MLDRQAQQPVIEVAELLEAPFKGKLEADKRVAARVLALLRFGIVLHQQELGHGGHHGAGEEIGGEHGEDHGFGQGHE